MNEPVVDEKKKSRAQRVKDEAEYALDDPVTVNNHQWTDNRGWGCNCCDGDATDDGFGGMFDAPVPRVVVLPPIFVSPGFSLMSRD